MRDDSSGDIERRSFIKGGAATLGLGALMLPGSSAGAEPAAPIAERIRRYPRLGRTGLEISDVSYGSSRTDDPAIVRHAFDRGINFFDSAESYKGGGSETSIGKALADVRDQVILTSKVKCGTGTTEKELMSSLEDSLRRLRTDRIDVYFNHAVNDSARLDNPEWYTFAERAKQQGKIRFTGMSGHAGRLVECLDHAIDGDLVDVVLVGYNFGQDPAFYQRFLSRIDWVAVQSDLPRVLAKAHEKGVGVVAMKTLRGARLNDMRPFEHGGATYAQAAFRWTLSNESVDALIVSMTSKEQVDEYVGASGATAPRGAALDLLEDYLLSDAEGYCEHGCEACHEACPSGVAVNEVLRTRMYATDYGDLAYARADYARLGAGAAACTSCSAKPCLGRCPSGLAVGRLTASAHRLLA
jgi:predicted aldo/keto reductase-like oxidoreductase